MASSTCSRSATRPAQGQVRQVACRRRGSSHDPPMTAIGKARRRDQAAGGPCGATCLPNRHLAGTTPPRAGHGMEPMVRGRLALLLEVFDMYLIKQLTAAAGAGAVGQGWLF